ncbi:unnamed protein product [Clonostachys rosea f. rosea IK726]|uniref:Uncharacterized protein n=1 Tax=Clonostachys rosea f. rosea IK726 TaxID=1349383 RepID=A0ACA9UT84_BIOOC|nr:unnamed protein product [Clonostachys rosea f. rosea IK726]
MSSKKKWSRWRGPLKRETEGNIPSEDPASVPEPYPTTANTPQGLEVVFEGDNPVVDIIAVHGLNGHREKTWTAANEINWLRDLLPHDLPHSRIIYWGYDANTHNRSRVSCQYLYGHAQTLVSDLCRKRRLTDSVKRPIIFVAHSLGGIIVKSALIHSDSSRQGALLEHRSIKLSTHGIVFMGTPHQGGNGVQLGQLLVNVASLFMAANDHILQHLKRDSEWLQQQLGQYGPISNEFITKYAYEEYETSTALGHKIMVVPHASAVVPGHADAEQVVIHNDHINMVKFASKQDSGYEKISGYLQIMMMDADDRIQLRWKEEARIAEARIDPTFGQWFLPLSLPGAIRVVHFVAREDELASIHEILHRTNGRSTAIVQGLGGMGKTQLTLEYIKRHSEEYSAVIWLNAKDEISLLKLILLGLLYRSRGYRVIEPYSCLRSRAGFHGIPDLTISSYRPLGSNTLKQTFAHAAERILRQHPSTVYIENAVRDKELDQITRAVKRWLEESRNSNWLVVYDNYDNPRFGSSTNESNNGKENEYKAIGLQSSASKDQGFDIRSFFPEGYQGAIIITTRSAAVKLGETVSLGKFRNIHDSLRILASTSHRRELDRDNATQELARRLDGLPLALATAGSYLSQVSTSWDQYLEIYDQSWLRLQKASPQLLTYDHAMYSTWDISYRYIERDDPNAAKLLQLWAYFDNEDVWFELLCDGASESEAWLQNATQDRVSFDTTMRLLCSHGLVEAHIPSEERGKQSGGYSVHGCVHSWMVHALYKGTKEDMSQLAMRCVTSHAPSQNVAEYWLIQRRLLRHASRCQSMLRRKEDMKAHEWIAGKLGQLFADQGRMTEAEEMYNRALQGYEKALGPEHTSTLGTVNNLGLLYYNQGRLKEAEEMYNRALQGYEKAWGPEHTSTLNTVNNLGNLYYNQGRLKVAEEMYNRALQGKEKALGPEHISTLSTVNNLGGLYYNQGRLKEAEEMYNRALQLIISEISTLTKDD